MMGTIAPRHLDLADLMADLYGKPTPADVAQFLGVSERSVWRWLADGSAPRAVLLALWYQTQQGQYEVGIHVGNECRLLHGMVSSAQQQHAQALAEVERLRALALALEQEMNAGYEHKAANCPVWRFG